MKKSLVTILSLGSLLFIPGLTLANTNQGVPLLFCPGTSEIVVGSIYNGKAHSTDGNWQGTSAIPPQYKNNWQAKIDSVNYSGGGYCQYFIGATEAIDLQDQHFPAGYRLYDITLGTDPLSNCWVLGTYQQTPTEPTENRECYYFRNPIF